MEQKIEADTSKYTSKADRILAAAECIKAQAAGKIVQSRQRADDAGWINGSNSWAFDSLDYRDYRVKPEPVRATRTLYVAYSNIEGPIDFTTRDGAMNYLRSMSGQCRVDMVFVNYEDGIEVARHAHTAGPR